MCENGCVLVVRRSVWPWPDHSQGEQLISCLCAVFRSVMYRSAINMCTHRMLPPRLKRSTTSTGGYCTRSTPVPDSYTAVINIRIVFPSPRAETSHIAPHMRDSRHDRTPHCTATGTAHPETTAHGGAGGRRAQRRARPAARRRTRPTRYLHAGYM